MLPESKSGRTRTLKQRFSERLRCWFAPTVRSRRLDAQVLEDRILYSATPLPVDAQLAGAGGIDQLDVNFADLDHALQSAIGDLPDSSPESALQDNVLNAGPQDAAADPTHRTALFIDSSLEDLDRLLQQYAQDDIAEVYLLDADTDGVAFIRDVLSASGDDYSAIHIVTHGSSGSVQLGSTLLSSANLADYQSQLAAWGLHLTDDADILIYGCDLASTAEGQSFIQTVASFTGADIAASEDATGHAALGGNWVLEYSTGSIDTGIAFTAESQAAWEHILAAITVNTTSDDDDGDTSSIANLIATPGTDGVISLREAIIAANNTPNAGGTPDQILFNIPTSDSGFQAIENGQFTISIVSALPDIIDPLVIDGTSQWNFVGTPVIEITGFNGLPTYHGLTITAGNSTVRGLIINEFSGDGIHISTEGGNTVEGNLIGLRPDGAGVIGGAIGWWKGENDAVDTVGDNDGTLVNGVAFGTGVVGQAFTFDGVNDYVDLGAAPEYDVADFTIEAWIEVDASTNVGERRVISRDDYAAPGPGGRDLYVLKSSFSGNDGRAAFSVMIDGQLSFISSSTAMSTGVHHLAGVRDGFDLRLYVDGVQVATATNTLSGVIRPNANLVLGRVSPASTIESFNGKIDEAALFGRALSAAEIAAGYTAGLSGHAPTLTSQVAYLQGEGDATDSRGIQSITEVGTVGYVAGPVGQAFSFAAAGDYLDFTDLSAVSSDTFSYTTWFKTTDASYGRLLAREFGNGQGWNLQMNPSGQYAMRVDTDSGINQSGGITAVAVNDDQWHFLAVTMDGATNQIRFSLDGGAFTSAVYAGEFTDMTGGHFRLGSGGVGGVAGMTGAVDEFQVHSRVLELAEVAQLYASGLRGDVGNAGGGIEINASAGNLIGGDSAAERNVISGNSGSGINVIGNEIEKTALSWWKADGTARDSNGSADGTLVGGTTYASGQYGQAFSFNGTTDYISTPRQMLSSALTFEAWINTTSSDASKSYSGDASDNIFGDSTGGVGIGFGITGGKLQYNVYDHVLGWVELTGTTSVNDGNWHHVAVTHETITDNVYLYIDGALEATGVLNYNGGAAVDRIGAGYNNTDKFNGLIDDAAIYAQALSANDIATLFQSRGSKGSSVISGNYIGTDVTGSKDRGNGSFGISLNGSDGNIIGGSTVGERNVISGNDVYGVRIWGHASQNLIAGNFIGTDASGTMSVANNYGVILESGSGNTIGVTTGGDGAGNVISGNITSGVHLLSHATVDNVVAGNWIGTDLTGTVAVGNTTGIQLVDTGSNVIGGDSVAERNVISGNALNGIYVAGNGAETDMVAWWRGDNTAGDVFSQHNGSLVSGTSFTTGVTGAANTAFSFDGVDDYVTIPHADEFNPTGAFSVDAWVKSSVTGDYKLIIDKSHGGDGYAGWMLQADPTGRMMFYFSTTGTDWVQVTTPSVVLDGKWHHIAGVYDGATSTIYLDGVGVATTAASGTPIGNSRDVHLGAWQNFGAGGAFQRFLNGQIDEAAFYSRALTASEIADIYAIGGAGKAGNIISGNYIGTNAAGTAALGNNHGITLSNTAANVIGGTTSGAGNLISGNLGNGIYLTLAHHNLVTGNLIGLNAAGDSAIPNSAGIVLADSWDNTLGGNSASTRNVVSGNTAFGIQITGTLTSGNRVQGNYIGTDVTGTAPLSNSTGILLQNNATHNLIGGAGAGEANVISGNSNQGIYIASAGSPERIVSWYKAENNTLDAIIGNDGALYGDTGYAAGIVGNGFSFDGSGDYVQLPNESAYDFVEQVFSVEGWFRTLASGVRQMIVSKGNVSKYQWDVEVEATNRLRANFNMASGTTFYSKTSTAAVNDGQWHHFAVSFDTRIASEDVRLYLDGVEQTTVPGDSRGTYDYNAAGSEPVRIGSRGDGHFFNGQIDEIAIYSRSLPAAEVAQQFQSVGQSKYGNIIFGNTIGRNAADTADLANYFGIAIENSSHSIVGGDGAGEGNTISGNTSHGVTVIGDGRLSGQIGYWKADGTTADLIAGTAGSLANGTSYTSGLTGQGFLFDGVDDYVQVGDSTAYELTGNSISIDAWIYPTGPGSNPTEGGMILNREWEYEIARFADGTIRWAMNIPSPGFTWYDTGYIAPENVWTHVALTYDGAFVKMYANNVEIYSVAAAGNISDGAGGTEDDLRIGGRQAGAPMHFQGRIDDVGLYNRGLNAAEIETIYLANAAGKTVVSPSNTIRGNSIYGNGGLGIDLGNDGVTANDAADSDLGANGLQNFPIIASATTSGSVVNVSGTLNSLPASTYTIDFYASASGNQGATYLGSKTVTTDGSGDVRFVDSFGGAVNPGDVITATVTDLRGNTSEFSGAVATTASGSILVVDTASDIDDGDTSSIIALLADRGSDGLISLREAILATNNTTNSGFGADQIWFVIAGSGPHRIEVNAALPDITDSLFIDGWSEPDFVAATGNPVIEIDGRNTTSGDGLRVTAGTSTIRGLAITNFKESGIELSGGSGHQVSGNHLGVSTSGIGFQPVDVAGWWTGDGTAIDFAGSNDGVLLNGATYAPGKVGQAFSLDGVNDHVLISDSASLEMSNQLTLQAWLKPTVTNSFRGVISKMAGGGNYAYQLLVRDGKLRLDVSSDGTAYETLTTANVYVTAGIWTHVAVTFNAGVAEFYVNGELAETLSAVSTTSIYTGGNSPVAIGMETGYGWNYAGLIDEPTVFNRVLSANELLANYQAGSDGIRIGNLEGVKISGGSANNIIGTNADGTNDAAERNLIGGNATGVLVAADAGSGNQIQGNLIGITDNLPTGAISYYTFDSSAADVLGNNQPYLNTGATLVAGKSGQAMSFDGVDDYIAVANSSSLTSANVTVDVWVKPDATGVNSTIVTKEGLVGSTEIGFGIRQRDDDHFWFILGREGAGAAIASSTTTLATGQWYHIVGTYDGANARLFVNGVLERTVAASVLIDSVSPLHIGRQLSNGGHFAGLIDELAIFDRALTTDEVKASYVADTLGMKGRAISNETGIRVQAANTDVGGFTATQRNVISGNDSSAVLITGAYSAGTGTDVNSNYIGTNLYGTGAIGNAWGVYAAGSSGNTIGGTNASTLFGSNLFYWDPAIGGNGHWYAISPTSLDWNAANDYAKSLGGDLSSITSLAEQTFINDMILTGGNETQSYWSGYTDFNATGNYTWTTGETSSFDYWKTGEPNTNDNAVMLNWNAGAAGIGRWNDIDAASAVRALIEFTVLPGGNVISGNTSNGIRLNATGATDNVVAGNIIGLDPSGTVDVGNYDGVYVSIGQRNTIGGSNAQDRNIISGNDHVGIIVADVLATSYADGTVIQGNFIGTDISGTVDLGNSSRGIDLSRSFFSQVGGTGAYEGNLISGNNSHGIWINGTGLQANRIEGNLIGTNAAGTSGLSNSASGIYITSSGNVIGGAAIGAGNVISGNGNSGITIDGSMATGNTVQGNFIGTNAAGTSPIANTLHGVYLLNAGSNAIGGDAAGEGNLISGNTQNGVYVSGNGAETGMVGWWKGDGSPNDALGLNNATLVNGATYATGVRGAANTAFSFNGTNQYASIADVNLLDLTDTLSLDAWINPSALPGAGLYHTVVSKGNSPDRNYGLFINSAGGVYLSAKTTSGDQNVTSAAGLLAIGQWSHVAATFNNITKVMKVFVNGVEVASQVYAGDLLANTRPLTIGSSDGSAFFNGRIDETALYSRELSTAEIADIYHAAGLGKAGNAISGNLIGTDVTGNAGLGNTAGGIAVSSSAINTLGGDSVAERNVIGANAYGISLNAARYNTLIGNHIGIGADGATGVGNVGSGVYLLNAEYNTIGGTTAGERNVISANGAYGLNLDTGSSYNTIQGNYIGTDATGLLDRGNVYDGIWIHGSSRGNTIGGSGTGAGNVISGNAGRGIFLDETPISGAVAWWTADGHARESINAYNGTLTNGATYAPGLVGQAFSFDGSNDYVQIGNPAGLNITDDLTVAAWIQPAGSGGAAGGGPIVVSKEGEWEIGRWNDGTIRWAFANSNPGWAWHNTGFVAAQGVWTHVAVSYQAGTVKTYANGVLIDTYAGAGTIGDVLPAQNDVRIGGRQGQPTDGFNGLIDEVAIFGRVLTAGEIATMVASGGSSLNGAGNHTLQGNIVGRNATNTATLANDSFGVEIKGNRNVIGGTAVGEGNIIAGNGNDGVWIAAGFGNRVIGNSMYLNGPSAASLGIDLASDGVNANDGAYSATQANQWIDSPVVTALTLDGSSLSVSGHVGAAAGDRDFAGVTIHLYQALSDPSGHGEGQTYLGELVARANGNFTGVLTGVSLSSGDAITATATDSAGNTSEFGLNARLYTLAGTVFEGVNYGGGAGRDFATAAASAPAFDIDAEGVTIELYDADGRYLLSTITDANGYYSFVVDAGNYHVRTVNETVVSNRSGATGSERAVQTYRVDSNNLIVNGDFSAGNSGFATDYFYGYVLGSQQYLVDVNPRDHHGAFAIMGDHTTGSGNMMIVNGAEVADQTVWEQTVSVDPNTIYNLGAWFAGVYFSNPATFDVQINSTSVGTLALDSTVGQWHEFFASWDSAGNTSATIRIVDTNAVGSGSDFVLDDISFFEADLVNAVTDHVGGETPSLFDATENVVSASLRAIRSDRALFDFENAGSLGLSEGNALATQFAGLTFTNAWIAQPGAPQAFFNPNDTVAGNAFGSYFIGGPSGSGVPMTVEFAQAVHQLAFDLVDIDASEQLAIRAYDLSGNLLESLVVAGGDAGTGDTIVTHITLNADNIKRLVLEPLTAIGWGLDHIEYGVAGTAQSVAKISIGASDVTGVDFGFNFDTIVNTNDSGQGSLRQFLLNSNALLNANLAQQGQIAGKEVSIFMIADGLPHAGLNASYANLLTTSGPNSGAAVISVASALPTISDSDTSLDATTQTTNVGNTNAGTVGTGGTVGVDGLTLSTIERPEVVLDLNNTMLRVTGNAATLKGFAVVDGGAPAAIQIGSAVAGVANRAEISQLLVGTFADGSDPVTQRNRGTAGLNLFGAGSVTNSYFAHNEFYGAYLGDMSSASFAGGVAGSYVFTDNEVYSNGWATVGYPDALGVSVAHALIEGNLIHGQLLNGGLSPGGRGVGIELIYGANNTLVRNNTVRDNAYAGIGFYGNPNTTGFGAIDNVIEKNIITGNLSGPGILVTSSSNIGGQPVYGNRLSQNAIYDNGGLGIDLSAQHVPAGAGANDGVTLNDGATTANFGNLAMDFPVITSALLSGSSLSVSGFVGTAAGDADFANSTLEFFASSGDATGYGEGQVYLGSLTSDVADGDFSGSFTLPLGVTLAAGQRITATATDAAGNTSEFSLNVALRSISGRVFEDADGNALVGAEAIGDVDNPGVAGATVKLYKDGGDGLADGVDDALIGTTSTASDGSYSFIIDAGTYWTVVDSKTVVSSTALNAGHLVTETWAEQTYGVAGAASGIGFQPVSGALYGGRNLELSDNASSLSTAEHVTRVIITTANVADIDSGFSFSTITRTGDGDDDLSTARSVQGSLRQFIQNSNALAGSQISDFQFQTTDATYNLTGNGEWTIRPTSALPNITDAIVIDGTIQAGFAGSPIVEISGSLAGANVDGLRLGVGSGGSSLRGLVINGFSSDGIEVLSGASGSTIAGNIIGLNVAGDTDLGNGGSGINVGNSFVTVGGTATADRNVLSGNAGAGIATNSNAQGLLVLNNIVGLDASGTFAIGNDYTGLSFWASANIQVGDGTAAGSNLIAGNQFAGILFTGPITAHSYLHNQLGTNATGNFVGSGNWGGIVSNMVGSAVNSILIDGNSIVGNSGSGVSFYNGRLTGSATVSNNTIGLASDGVTLLGGFGTGIQVDNNITQVSGLVTISGNEIAGSLGAGIGVYATPTSTTTPIKIANNTIHDGGSGVVVTHANSVAAITANSIYDHAGLAIDLGDDGITLNDAHDSDSGPNGLQNYPLLSLANFDGVSSIHLVGSLHSNPSTTYRVEFFVNRAADASGHGEAERYLGAVSTTTGIAGNATFDTVLPFALSYGEFVTATATVDLGGGSLGSTSEFSQNISVNEQPVAAAVSYSTSYIDALVLPTPGVLAGAVDPDGDNLTAVLIAGPASGSLTLRADGSLSYNPVAGFIGRVAFVYYVTDGLFDSLSQTITIDVHVPFDVPPPLDAETPGTGKPGEGVTGETQVARFVIPATKSLAQQVTASIPVTKLTAVPGTAQPVVGVSIGVEPQPVQAPQASVGFLTAVDRPRALQAIELEPLGFRSGEHAYDLRSQELSRMHLDRLERSLFTQVETSRLELVEVARHVEEVLAEQSAGGLDPVVSTVIGTGVVVLMIHLGNVAAALFSSMSVGAQLDPLSLLKTTSEDANS